MKNQDRGAESMHSELFVQCIFLFIIYVLSIWINVSIYVRYEGACHLLLDFGIWVFCYDALSVVCCVEGLIGL